MFKNKGNNDCPIYIDLRLIGSTGGLYSDRNIPFSERATRLLIDVFTAIHDQIIEFVVENASDNIHMGVIGPLLEKLSCAISQIQITGEITKEVSKEFNDEDSNKSEINLGTSSANINLSGGNTYSVKLGEKMVNSGFEIIESIFLQLEE